MKPPKVASRVTLLEMPGGGFDSSTHVSVGATQTQPAQVTLDFSHGDVGAFKPPNWAFEAMRRALADGGRTAYTEYRGSEAVRETLAERLSVLLRSSVDGRRNVILTPGSQAALYLGLSALVDAGDRVALVEPDYFANRRIIRYLGGVLHPVRLDYSNLHGDVQLDLEELKRAFAQGARVVCMSNPNNPTGSVYSRDLVESVLELCLDAGAFLVVDELYCRLIYPGTEYTHVRSYEPAVENCLTLLGVSKTESLSGFRLGVAVGPDWLIDRMESILSIVALRAPGYAQWMLQDWLVDDARWLKERIDQHEILRDRCVEQLSALEGLVVRPAQGGSYLFPRLPQMRISGHEFVRYLRHAKGIVVTPGNDFGSGLESSFRINYSQEACRMARALERLVDTAREFIV